MKSSGTFALLLSLVFCLLGTCPPASGQKRPAAPPIRKSSPTSKQKAPAKGTAKPAATTVGAAKASARPGKKTDESVAFFADGPIPHLKITISDGELQKLRQADREYVRCEVTEDSKKVYRDVGIHLKGAAGSYRSIDDKPALTLNFDKFAANQKFHGLTKIHLNNSVQDPSYLNELLAGELFLAAGVPAARTTHARVWLNGRDIGVAVLKEGFNKNFLSRHFENVKGNLYDGGFVQDLDGQPKLMNGEGPKGREDIQAVIAACREPDETTRWQRMRALIDIDRFLAFAALEQLLCHWDGYCRNRNNYRYYFDPKSGKVVFFPHGLDQLFSDPGFDVLNPGGSMICDAILARPEWRAAYRDKLTALAKQFVPAERLTYRVNTLHKRLRPIFEELGETTAQEFDGQIQALKERITARSENISRVIGEIASNTGH